MTGTRATLKQFGRLRRLHFEQAPVWVACHSFDYDKPWYEDTTEETFRPWTGETPFDPGLGMAVVSASFTLADGTILRGFVTPLQEKRQRRVLPDLPDLADLQPHLFGRGGIQLGFWSGILVPDPTTKARFYKAVGRAPSEVFPIHFNADPGLARGLTAGVLEGFCYSPDLKTATFAV